MLCDSSSLSFAKLSALYQRGSQQVNRTLSGSPCFIQHIHAAERQMQGSVCVIYQCMSYVSICVSVCAACMHMCMLVVLCVCVSVSVSVCEKE